MAGNAGGHADLRVKTPKFYRASPNLLTFTTPYRGRFYLSAKGEKCVT
jgi:hypothetical protein